jgi:hypothetical protein
MRCVIVTRSGGGTPVVASRVPCFAQRTFHMAELGAERERMRSCLEELASVETEVLVESGEEEILFWD